MLDKQRFGVFRRVYVLHLEREIDHVLTEQHMLPIGPRIRASARYVRGLARLYELCSHSQQEIAVDGQSIGNRSDQQGLNGSKVRHLHVGDRIILRNSLAQRRLAGVRDC